MAIGCGNSLPAPVLLRLDSIPSYELESHPVFVGAKMVTLLAVCKRLAEPAT